MTNARSCGAYSAGEMRTLRIFAFLCICAALLASCGRKSTSTRSRGAPVILISIDTLRSDHLPAYGYRGVSTPNIDSLRRDSVLFARAYSNSPMTLPSHASILTGLLPADHGVRNDVGYRLDAEKTNSLPCALRTLGYHSAAAVSAYAIRSESGIGGCFDDYDDSIEPQPGAASADFQRSGMSTLEIATSWIGRTMDEKFFYFFHIDEPHAPYSPPEPYRSRYANPYDGEIAYADAIVGQFLDYLRTTKLYDQAIIILLSDHGEGLGDHGEDQHSILLYREAIQVPLIIKLPNGNRRGTSVEGPVQLTDIAPTVRALAGGKWNASYAGRSLFGADSSPRKVFSETMYPRIHLGWSDLESLIDGRYHYIAGPQPELYDLVADPAERYDLARQDRGTAASMQGEIAKLTKPLRATENVDPEAAKMLAALGYTGTARNITTAESLPNPRDGIQVLERLRQALLLADSGMSASAIKALQSIVTESPSMVDAWTKLAEVQSAAGDYDGAARSYREAIGRSPVLMPDIVVQSGFNLLRLGRVDEARTIANQLLSESPQKANELRARVALISDDLSVADEAARKAIEASREDPTDLVLLAEVQEKRGDAAAASVTLDRAEARARSPLPGASLLRGNLAARRGDRAASKRFYRAEIASFPHHLEAYASLAIVQFIEGDRRGVDETLNEMASKNPSRAAYMLAAKTLEALGDVHGAEKWRVRGK